MILRKRPGFTLMELITILLFVGVQVAVLYPVMEKSREESRKSACQTNMKSCSIALQVYLNDWDSGLPSSVIVANAATRVPTQAEVVQFVAGPSILPTDLNIKRTTWAQIIREYMPDKNCITCPSDPHPGRLSYWYKYAADLAWRDAAISARKESDFTYPGRQIIFYEHAGWHTEDAAGVKDGVTINVAHLDSSIATVTIKNGPAAYPTPADEASGASAVRLGEPMYYNFDSTTNTSHTGTADWVNPRRYYDKF